MTLDPRTIIELIAAAVIAGGLVHQVHDLRTEVRELKGRFDTYVPAAVLRERCGRHKDHLDSLARELARLARAIERRRNGPD